MKSKKEQIEFQNKLNDFYDKIGVKGICMVKEIVEETRKELIEEFEKMIDNYFSRYLREESDVFQIIREDLKQEIQELKEKKQ